MFRILGGQGWTQRGIAEAVKMPQSSVSEIVTGQRRVIDYRVLARAGDAYLQTIALNHAGLGLLEHGQPNDGLKLLQLGQARSWDIPADDGRTTVIGEGSAVAAQACARVDYVAASLQLEQGRLDTAEPFAAASVRRWLTRTAQAVATTRV